MSNVPELAQSLQMAIKALMMYTPAHPRAAATLQTLGGVLSGWLQSRPNLHLAATGGKLFVDGVPVEVQNIHIQTLAKQLTERQIAGFIIQRGVEEEELLAMLQVLIHKPAKLDEMGGVAKVMADLKLRHITLSQTQYREVREGEGGADETAAPMLSPVQSTPKPEPPTSGPEAQAAALAAQIKAASPLLEDMASSLRQWKVQLLAASDHLALPPARRESRLPMDVDEDTGTGRYLGQIQAADLSGLGSFAREHGWGDGFPSDTQLDALRQALQGLPPETRLGVLKGLDSAPAIPAGLRMGLEALVPELFSSASAELVAQGTVWGSLREQLFDLLMTNPGKQQPMLAGFEARLRQQALDTGTVQDLIERLDWENQSLDGRIQIALGGDRLWNLGASKQLDLLRDLLDKGRTEPFLRILEAVVSGLKLEDPRIREVAAQTLSGVTAWTSEPGFPSEAFGLLQESLCAHFAWEPVLHIHRLEEEAFAGFLAGLLQLGEPVLAQNLLLELEGLCAFLEEQQEWRQQALLRLRGRLASAEMLSLACEVMYQADAMAVLSIFAPYFEFLGEPAAQWLVNTLGEEPDRKRRGRLLELIKAIGPLAMPALQNGLHSSTWYLVRNTLNLLSEMGDAHLLEDVSQCLQHADGRVRRAAVRAAWKLGGPASAPHLLGIFLESDPETQVEVLFGLAHVQSAAAVPVLGEFAATAQTPEKLRIKTAETLGLIKNPAAIPFLVELIRRKGRIFTSAEPLELRLAAAQALVSIGAPPALDALRKLVSEEPRGEARDALSRLCPEGAK